MPLLGVKAVVQTFSRINDVTGLITVGFDDRKGLF